MGLFHNIWGRFSTFPLFVLALSRMSLFPCSSESVYTGYEVDDDWCLSVLQSYQTDRETLFPWSVGTCFIHRSHAHFHSFKWVGVVQMGTFSSDFFYYGYSFCLKQYRHLTVGNLILYFRWRHDARGQKTACSILGMLQKYQSLHLVIL